MKSRVLIIVDGGNIQAVYSNTDARIDILDHDNLRETHDRDKRERVEIKAIGTLSEKFTHVVE